MNRLTMMNVRRIAVMVLVVVGLAYCSRAETAGAAAEQKTTTVDALRARMQAQGAKPLLVDVREPAEFDGGHIEGALLVPLATVEKGFRKVPKEQEIVLVCRSGNRSGKAQKLLISKGYTNVANTVGGMLAWEQRGYPVVKKQ